MSKYKRILVIGLLLCVSYFIFTLFENDDVYIPPIQSAGTSKVPVKDLVEDEKSADISDVAIPKIAQRYLACASFEVDFRKSEKHWLNNGKPDWQSFLKEGYSLDAITTAIEHFQNSNFAVSFRVEQLRNNSSLVEENHSLMQQARSLFPQMFNIESPLRVQRKVPQTALKDFNTLSSSEKTNRLHSNTPSVDDIAYFITDNNYSDDDVLLLLSQLEDPSATVGYYKLDAISLIDYAVNANRLRVVEHLLDIGVTITDDGYLGSTMDWALANLMIASEEKQQDAAKIVSLVWSKGGKANFTEQKGNGIEGRFPRKFFRFSAEEVALLQQRHGIDLRLIEQRDALKVDKSSELISRLTKSREDYLARALARENVVAFRQECRNIIANLNGMWNPSPIHSALQANINENDSAEAIKARLAAIDPILVDTYSTQYFGVHGFTPVGGLDGIFRNVGETSIFDVIDEVLALGLSDEENNYAAIQLLQFDASYFDELKSSGLMAQEPSYYVYKIFKLIKLQDVRALYESGANLMSVDEYGKTLLYYAAIKRDIALIKYMSEESFPYQLSELGEDPLHVVLRRHTSLSADNPFYIYDTVDALMAFNPNIDAHHLSRMALLKYTAPYNYLKIVEQYPMLEPTDDTPLPSIRL